MKWVSTFSYLPVDFTVEMGEAENQTQEIFFDNNIEGDQVRLRFSNRYGKKPLELAGVEVSVLGAEGTEKCHPVTRHGSPRICLKPGEECWSDETTFAVAVGERICIRTQVDKRQSIGSLCMFWSATGPAVQLKETGGDQEISFRKAYPVILQDEYLKEASYFYGISGMQVWTKDQVKTVAMFGDSITHMSYLSNALIRRLYAQYPGKVAVVNRGLGGNRLLRDASEALWLPGKGSNSGDAGIRRFEKDVFGEDTADLVMVLEGVNDIMHPVKLEHPGEKATARELVEGLGKLIQTAHGHGARIFGGTILPCAHESYCQAWIQEFEEIRLEVNKKIREGVGFDGWVDYDAGLRNEENPAFMQEKFHMGDGLHPNDLGGEQMAELVDLAELMGEKD